MSKKNIIVAITGASGSHYARILCELLLKSNAIQELAVIITKNGWDVMQFEEQTDWLNDKRITRYENSNLFSPPASGSASYDAMVVVPCSMGMIGRLASGTADDLISRAADVMLKERRRLIVVPRETPFSTIHLRNLLTLSESGAIVAPASPSFYSLPKDIEELSLTLVERLVTLLGIDIPHYQWGEKKQ